MKKALLALSGDPITFGHIDLAERASKLAEKVTFAHGMNSAKTPTFSNREKREMDKHSLAHLPNVDIEFYDDSLASFAFRRSYDSVLRGARSEKDFSDEKDLFNWFKRQGVDVEYQILISDKDLVDVSSSIVKGSALAQGFLHHYVPIFVKQRVDARLLGQYPIGVTGSIATGKSFTTIELIKAAERLGYPAVEMDLDAIGHSILKAGPDYQRTRDEIASTFGSDCRNPNGSINRSVLGKIVFNDDEKIAKPAKERLDKIMDVPLSNELHRKMHYKKGLILHNAALIAEFGLGYLCNNNFLITNTDSNIVEQRLIEERVKTKKMTLEQVKRRLESQYTSEKKKEILEEQIRKDRTGQIWTLDTSKGVIRTQYEQLVEDIVRQTDIFYELRFAKLWHDIKADGSYEDAYQSVLKAYMDPRRAHHDLSHIMMCLDDRFIPLANNPLALKIAMVWHDFVMKKNSRIDEERSADLMYGFLKSCLVDESLLKEAKEIIVDGTKHSQGTDPKKHDSRLAASLDLLVFGQSYERVLEYDDDIRWEYTSVPDEVFNPKRREVLEKFANKKRIYLINEIADLYENIAKENIRRLIKERYS